MRSLMLLPAAGLLALGAAPAAAVDAAPVAEPCKPDAAALPAQVEQAAVVASATIVEVTTSRTSTVATVRVTNTHKGDLGEQAQVVIGTGPCELTPKPAEAWLVVASRDERGQLVASPQGDTQALDLALERRVVGLVADAQDAADSPRLEAVGDDEPPAFRLLAIPGFALVGLGLLGIVGAGILGRTKKA